MRSDHEKVEPMTPPTEPRYTETAQFCERCGSRLEKREMVVSYDRNTGKPNTVLLPNVCECWRMKTLRRMLR